MSQRRHTLRTALGRCGALAVAILLGPAAAASAQSPLQTFSPAAAVAGAGHGAALAADGDVIVAGAPYQKVGTHTYQGAAWVYRRVGGTWIEEQQLVSADGAAYDLFGASVSLQGDLILVGAPGDHAGWDDLPGVGRVHAFRWNGATWAPAGFIDSPLIVADTFFGSSVAQHGDVVVIGADLGRFARVYRWHGSDLQFEAHLQAPAGPAGDFFGYVVRVHGDVIAVSAVEADVGPSVDQGAVYVYRWNGLAWAAEQTLLADDGQPVDWFGESLDCGQDVIAVGAARHDLSAGDTDEGAAYVFRWNGSAWSQEQKLLTSTGQPGDDLGRSIVVRGGLLAVGAAGEFLPTGPLPGSVTLFHEVAGSWVEGAHLELPDAAAGDQFGAAVALTGGLLAVGASLDDVGAKTDVGSAAVYSVLGAAWSDLGHALPGALGAPSLTGEGTLQAGSPLALSLHDARPSAPTALVLGFSVLDAPFKGGVLVPAADILIAGLHTNAAGSLVLASAWPAGVPSGFMFLLQSWIADPLGSAGFSASNGLSATTP